MAENATAPRRTRIEEISKRPPLGPFVRANQVTGISLYWAPVRAFPVPFRPREWLLALLGTLDAHFEKNKLLSENFLQLKHTRTDLNRRFTQTLLEYEPVTGVLLSPGQELPQPPTSLQIKKLVEAPDANAEIGIAHLAPDYCAWFLNKKGKEQRNDFFGVGGMLFLWVEGDEANAPAPIRLPKSLATHPAMAGQDFNAQFRKLHSMRAPWLKNSKEVFGETMREDAMMQGVPFVLPQLNANAFLSATVPQLEQWFGVFHAVCLESVADGGVLLAVGEPDFDRELEGIVEKVCAAQGEYEGL